MVLLIIININLKFMSQDELVDIVDENEGVVKTVTKRGRMSRGFCIRRSFRK